MHHAYLSYQIAIYSDEPHQDYFRWAKTFYLMQSAHPICLIKSCSFSRFELFETSDVLSMLKQMGMDLPLNFKGLLVPITAKPLVEIDFLQTNLKENKIAFTEKKLPILCIENLHNPTFHQVDIEGVFEDFYSKDAVFLIDEELKFMQLIAERSLLEKAP